MKKDFRKIRYLGRSFEEVFFPRRCPICDDVIPFGEPPDTIGALTCRCCLRELSFIQGPTCRKCGRALSEANKGSGLCSDCSRHIRMFERSFALLSYGPLERDIMSDIKYRSKRSSADLFSLLAARRFRGELSELSPDCIIPVPVHKNRLRKRGYNQAALFARDIARHTGIPFREDLLIRSLETKAQKGLGYEGRILNLQGAFLADSSACREVRSLVLVDDIYTTGSTLEACTEELLRAGVEKVYGLCICAGRDT